MSAVATVLLTFLVLAGVSAVQRINCNSNNCSHDQCDSTTEDRQNFGLELRQMESKLDTDTSFTSTEDTNCSYTWFYTEHDSNGSTNCKCGKTFHFVLDCNSEEHKIKLTRCYCMTISKDNDSQLVVGPSFYGCFAAGYAPQYAIPKNPHQLDNYCKEYNRDGQLCGKCRKGFAPPVYSYNMSCVDCSDYGSNWMKYLAVAFLPLTAFFILVITFRISATSGLLNTFILVSQLVSTPVTMRTLTLSHINSSVRVPVYLVASFYGMWNLDFFRPLYSPFCVHPEMTTLQALALDYVIATYPLFLIAATYVLVEMHDNGFRVVIWLWKPFYKCFARFRREWNIRNSLIDGFATFMLLSYVKFLSVSVDLLIPIRIFDIKGKFLNVHYLYYDGSLEYFGKEHLPYGILALVVLVVFNILPLLLLCLYPCRCFQTCLNCCRRRYQVSMRTFMDAFHGHYKNGTNGTRDCRWFAALHLTMRGSLFLAIAVTVSEFGLVIFTILALIMLFLTAVFHPYKSRDYNKIDIFLLTTLAFTSLTMIGKILSYSRTPQFKHTADILIEAAPLILPIYLITVLLYKLFSRVQCIRNIYYKIRALLPYSCRKQACNDSEETHSDRAIHEYSSLLAKPV